MSDPVPSSAIYDATTGGRSVIVITGGSTGDVLTLQANGTYAAETPAGASPGGSSGQMQFNNAGAFGGTTAVVYAGSGTHVTVTAQSSTAVPLCVKGAASQTGNLTEWKNSSGTTLSRVLASGRFSSSLNLTQTEVFGETGTAHAFCTLMGFGAASTGAGVAIVFGGSSSAGSQSAAFGFQSVASAAYATVLGSYGTAAHASSVCIGRGSATSKANQAVIGATGIDATQIGAVSELCLGGAAGSTPYAVIYTACQGTGTNITGSKTTLAAGRSTGSATPAVVAIATTTAGSSGTTVQTLRDVLQCDGNTTAGETPLLLLDIDKGTLQRVSIGAADSGGTGFKVLRVPN